MKKWILYISAILILCSSVANADDFDDGVDAYKKGEYAQTIKLWRPLAVQGNSAAQYNLGVMYYEGKGVIQDYKEAVKWFRFAAEQGYAKAQLNLGLMYSQGAGIKQDYVRSHMWLNLAASNGHKNGRENREIIAKMITPTQIAEAQEMARECVKKNYKNCE